MPVVDSDVVAVAVVGPAGPAAALALAFHSSWNSSHNSAAVVAVLFLKKWNIMTEMKIYLYKIEIFYFRQNYIQFTFLK